MEPATMTTDGNNFYSSWRLRLPCILEGVLHQQIDCCWAIGLTRQLIAMCRLWGLLDTHESLSIQFLINGVLKEHLTNRGAIHNLMVAGEFLKNEGTVLDRLCPLTYELGKENKAFEMNVTKFKVSEVIVHERMKYETVEKFESEMLRLAAVCPLAIAIHSVDSFQHIGHDIFMPMDTEINSGLNHGYHVMFLTGTGKDNGVIYYEAQDSSGEGRGENGFVKIGVGVITHFVEFRKPFCTPVNPNIKFKDLDCDHFLYTAYIKATKAHASMLFAKKLVTESEKNSIVNGLEKILEKINSKTFEYRTDPEDVERNVETCLVELIGETAVKLQRARSKMDRVSTGFRIWCRMAVEAVVFEIKSLQRALVQLACNSMNLIVPMLPRAQPVLLSLLLLSYVEKLGRDVARYIDCHGRFNFCPLGACGLAGTYLPIDRDMTANSLKFAEPMRNSIDAASDRDYVLEILSANSITAGHISCLAEDWILWSSERFGFINPNSSTGCSMVQKEKHLHPMELVKTKAARVKGCLSAIQNFNAPFTYEQDFQEDRGLMFNSVRTIFGMIKVSFEFAQHVTFDEDKIKKSLPAPHLDDDTLVFYLHAKGRSLTDSQDIVENIVGYYVSQGLKLEDISLSSLKERFPHLLGDDFDQLFSIENYVHKFYSVESTGPRSVTEQLKYWRNQLGTDAGT